MTTESQQQSNDGEIEIPTGKVVNTMDNEQTVGKTISMDSLAQATETKKRLLEN